MQLMSKFKLFDQEKISIFSTHRLGSILKAYLFNSVTPSLLLQGQILADSTQKIALMWVPKAGATFGVKWFFAQTGLLEEAIQYHKFVHYYRDDLYRYSSLNRISLGDFLKRPDEYSVIKIVRHPLKRAVSSYIHAVKFKFAYQELSRLLGRPVDQDRGFSFREFVSYLEAIDIYTCNIHFRTQSHILERSGKISINYLIDLDESVERLGELEKILGLRQTDLSQLSESKHHTTRTDVEGFYGDRIDYFGRKKRKGREIVTPPAKNFYDSELMERVGKIYADDFERYGYLPIVEQL